MNESCQIGSNHDFNLMLSALAKAKSFKGAEDSFKTIVPFVERLSIEQSVQLLKVALANGQVIHSSLCATKYLAPLAKAYAHHLSLSEQRQLSKALQWYAG